LDISSGLEVFSMGPVSIDSIKAQLPSDPIGVSPGAPSLPGTTGFAHSGTLLLRLCTMLPIGSNPSPFASSRTEAPIE